MSYFTQCYKTLKQGYIIQIGILPQFWPTGTNSMV